MSLLSPLAAWGSQQLAGRMKMLLSVHTGHVVALNCSLQKHAEYRICSIRRRSYYLFHRAILCGFYSRAATNRERRLLNSVFLVKFFVIVRALRKASFIRRIAMQLDQPPLCYKAVYLHGTSNPFPRFLPMISHDDRPPCLKKCRTPLDSVRSCTYCVLIWYLGPRFVHVRMCYLNIS